MVFWVEFDDSYPFYYVFEDGEDAFPLKVPSALFEEATYSKEFNWSFKDGKFKFISGDKSNSDISSSSTVRKIVIHADEENNIFTEDFSGNMTDEMKKKIEELKAGIFPASFYHSN